MTLEQKIEAVLFYKAKPLRIGALLAFFEASEDDLGSALVSLQQSLRHRGIRLIISDNKEVQLVTAPEVAEIIELLRKDDLKKDIGSAGAETLAIILYRGPISRAEIDRVRGVNSSFIIRNLLIRGLVERAGSQDDRSHNYQVTPALLAQLGIEQKEQLPDFAAIASELDAFTQADHTQSVETTPN
jgi:segregation and condensation protein B